MACSGGECCCVLDQKLPLNITVPETELAETRQLKLQTLNRRGLSLDGHCLSFSGNSEGGVVLPDSLLSTLRVILAMDWEFYFLQYGRDPAVPFVSYWNELKVFKFLRNLLIGTIQNIESASFGKTEQETSGSITLLHGHVRLARAAITALQLLCDALSPDVSSVQDDVVRPESLALQQFHQWFQRKSLASSSSSSQVRVQAVDFKNDCRGRGLVATQTMVPGEAIVSVPWDLVISVDSARKSKYAKVFSEAGLDEEETVMLFVLLELDDPNSEWAPYWKVVPRTFTSPLLWTFDELMELEGNSILEDITQAKNSLQEIYDKLFPRLSLQYPTVFPAQKFTFERFLVTRCIFDSRCFKLNVDGRNVNCLIPLADMVNHYVDGNVAYRRFDTERQCVVLEALREIRPGVEVRMNYGLLQNWECLMQYGFVDPNNADDSVHFSIFPSCDPDEEEATFNRIAALLDQHNIDSEHWLPVSGKPAPQLLAALRCCVADEDDLAQIESSNWDPLCCEKLNDDNELRMLDTLECTLTSLASAYPTTLEETHDRLETDDSLSINQRIALTFRACQQKILMNGVAFIDTLRTGLTNEKGNVENSCENLGMDADACGS